MIGNIIQEKRKAAGLTQAQLADMLGVSAPAVNRWEKNLCFPDATLLAPLARCLKTDINSLFSFYDSLSDKERDLIVDHASKLLLRASDKEALSYIEDSLRVNLSDGELYLKLANLLRGYHSFLKDTCPTAYLAEATNCYEQALRLLPERQNDIVPQLLSIYAESGKTEKAEEIWQQFPEESYPKKWLHAEMQYDLRNYSAAALEAKELILKDIITLVCRIKFLKNALSQTNDHTLAELAEQKATALEELFDLFLGDGSSELLSRAIINKDANGEIEQYFNSFDFERMDKPISSCPLFSKAV